MAGTGFKASVRTHKGEIPSADANGMIAYLLDNTGATGMTISRFLGVSQSQVSTVKRRIDGGARYEHVHPVLHGFNMDDLFDEQTKTVESKSVAKLTEDFEKPSKEAQEMEHGTVSLDVNSHAQRVRDAVQKDMEVAQKHMSTPKVDTEVIGDAQDEDSHLRALEEFADKIVADRMIRRERALTEAGIVVDDEVEAFYEANKDKEEAWKTMEKDLGLSSATSTYRPMDAELYGLDGISQSPPPLPKQMVETMTLNTKGTGHVLSEMVSILVKALDPEKTYKLHLVYEEI